MGVTEARSTIRRIDRQIDSVRAELKRREGRQALAAEDAQAMWNRNPDLRAREVTLFRERGDALVALAQAEREIAARKPRLRRKTCPTCGAISFAAA